MEQEVIGFYQVGLVVAATIAKVVKVFALNVNLQLATLKTFLNLKIAIFQFVCC